MAPPKTSTATTTTTTKRAKAAAPLPEPTDVTPAPIPATVADSPSPEKPQAAGSPVAATTEAPSQVDEVKKNKPLKLARNKAQKWLESLKKVQDSNPHKLLSSITGGLETLLAHDQNAAARASNRNLSGYNLFVQNNIRQVAAQNANLSNKEVMVKIAEMWQQHKASTTAQA